MPTKPEVQNLDANSAQILNAIRANASPEYKAAIPVASPNTDSVRAIGKVLLDFHTFQNEFIHALVNRIGRVIITSKMYSNPWAFFKKGLMEYGETIEEIFIRIAEPHDFDPEAAETQLYKREIPDVLAAFHSLNYQKFYKVTTTEQQLRQAFLSWNGVTELIAGIIDSMYAAAEYDEFIVMKYLLARVALDGGIAPVTIAAATGGEPIIERNAKLNAATIKAVSNSLEFMSTKYNMAGVQNYTRKGDQYLIMNSAYDAIMDVEVLASSFNMGKAEFLGHRVLVDGFGIQDVKRLTQLLGSNPAYQPFTDAEITKLESIAAILVDRDFFMIFDNLLEVNQKYNEQGLYWNHWLHTWKTLSVSPFANAAMFTTLASSTTGLAITPDAPTVPRGGSVQFAATATGEGFTSGGVNWEVSGNNSNNTYISAGGALRVARDETADTLTVKATSVSNTTVTAETSVTIQGG